MKFIFWIVCFYVNCICADVFIWHKNHFFSYNDRNDVIVVASTGRSGSTLLVQNIERCSPEFLVLKTHLLIPYGFRGKIIFIFSNPDLIAESVLHVSLAGGVFLAHHFNHLFSSDKAWFEQRIEANPLRQTLEDNLLAYDALGIGIHLKKWLIDSVTPVPQDEAEILAIKYENLWDAETQQALINFCSLTKWKMPEKIQRGYSNTDLYPLEIIFKDVYNEGTQDDPKYKAYAFARDIWQAAPPFQFLKRKFTKEDTPL